MLLIYSIMAEPKPPHHNVNFDLPVPIFDNPHIFTISQKEVERNVPKMCVLISDD